MSQDFAAFIASTCKMRVLFALADRGGGCQGQFCSSLSTMELGMASNEPGFRCVRSQHLQAEGALRSGGLKRRLQRQFCSSLSTMELGMASNEPGFHAFRANTCKLRVFFALAGR